MSSTGSGIPASGQGAGVTTSPLFWRRLFSLLKERKLIPVVGQDAVIVEDENGPCTLNEYIARRVEAILELRVTEPPRRPNLHEVACRFLESRRGQDIGDLYFAVWEAAAEKPVAIPEALRKLARIEEFTLYVTTTFDDLLQRAIDEERFHGNPRTQACAYSPGRVDDLPVPVDRLTGPAVYSLLGRMSSIPDYAVTEEDTLEFVHSLQSDSQSPRLLLGELRSHNLLLIGSGYSDWLMRFFLRIARHERLLIAGNKMDIVVDSRVRDDASLADFLRHFSVQTKVFTGGAVEFIDQLFDRWEEQRARALRETGPPPPLPQPDCPIFISYAEEDFATAERLAAALRAARLAVWLDKRGGLEGGDIYEEKIRQTIHDAVLFVPILSRHVLTRQKRFFRVEWDAAKRALPYTMPNQPFIVPVRIDDVPKDAAAIELEFRRVHWIDAPGGDDFGPVVQRLQALYREYRLSMSGGS